MHVSTSHPDSGVFFLQPVPHLHADRPTLGPQPGCSSRQSAAGGQLCAAQLVTAGHHLTSPRHQPQLLLHVLPTRQIHALSGTQSEGAPFQLIFLHKLENNLYDVIEFGPKVSGISPKWDKCETFSDRKKVLDLLHLGPLWNQIAHP